MRSTCLKIAMFVGLTAVSTAAMLVVPSDREANAGGPLETLRPEGGTGRDSGVISKTPPDPTPMNERLQWVFDLRWDRGDVYLLDIHKQDMGGPHPTPRAMGRFALELFEGPTLIERVRFDFPLLGAPEVNDSGVENKIRFEPKLKTRIGVFFPATKRGTRLELWDRARDIRWQLPWPPTEGAQKPVQKGTDASLD